MGCAVSVSSGETEAVTAGNLMQNHAYGILAHYEQQLSDTPGARGRAEPRARGALSRHSCAHACVQARSARSCACVQARGVRALACSARRDASDRGAVSPHPAAPIACPRPRPCRRHARGRRRATAARQAAQPLGPRRVDGPLGGRHGGVEGQSGRVRRRPGTTLLARRAERPARRCCVLGRVRLGLLCARARADRSAALVGTHREREGTERARERSARGHTHTQQQTIKQTIKQTRAPPV